MTSEHKVKNLCPSATYTAKLIGGRLMYQIRNGKTALSSWNVTLEKAWKEVEQSYRSK